MRQKTCRKGKVKRGFKRLVAVQDVKQACQASHTSEEHLWWSTPPRKQRLQPGLASNACRLADASYETLETQAQKNTSFTRRACPAIAALVWWYWRIC